MLVPPIVPALCSVLKLHCNHKLAGFVIRENARWHAAVPLHVQGARFVYRVAVMT